MISPSDHNPTVPPSDVRFSARLDQTTRQKVDDLAQRFHRPRASVLTYIMQWGLSRGQTGTLDGGESDGPARHLFLYVDTELHTRVEQAATTAGVKITPWLRHMVRQITINDFPGQLAGGNLRGTLPRLSHLW